MNRRSFFGLITAGLAAAADPERLLWVPGRKLISIPKAIPDFPVSNYPRYLTFDVPLGGFQVGDRIQIDGETARIVRMDYDVKTPGSNRLAAISLRPLLAR
jgi:hypothetical protein